MRIRFSTNSISLWQITVFVSVMMIAFSSGRCSGEAAKGKNELYAVVVGISKYSDPTIPPLSISDKDARDFSQFLKEQGKLFAKPPHIWMFLNEQATRANVVKALRDNLIMAGKDDTVIVFLSGHGASDPKRPDEFYFVTYDGTFENLYGTALLMNAPNLFKGIDSDRVFLIADACHSGGFADGLRRASAKGAASLATVFQNAKGRFCILSSKPGEESFEDPLYGNSVFTHFLLKGLRGEAASASKSGTVTPKDIYEYVYTKTKEATKGLQHPQLLPKDMEDSPPVFPVKTFQRELNLTVQFYSEDDSGLVKPLESGATLKCGQKVGLTFRADSDCFVYILWWDSNGAVGKLFPNPKLTEGTGEVKGGRTYWLPSQGGERWYCLDENPGQETVYFIASRERNPTIEALYDSLQQIATQAGQGAKSVSAELERQINLMGFADVTTLKKSSNSSFGNKEELLAAMENKVKVSGADALITLKINHIPR